MARLFTSVVLAVLVAACGGGEPESTKYTQTWTTPYGETTCIDWNTAMNDHQRFVMAADMLYSARKRDGGDEIPPDSMIAGFEAYIQSVCDADFGEMGGKVSEAAALAYTLDATYHP